MKKTVLLPILVLVLGSLFAQTNTNKASVIASIERQSDELIAISDKIWALAETAFEETGSAELLADYAEAQGFRVQRGVAEMPTAFIAEYGSGKPIIGILGEYDALPGLSQATEPHKSPIEAGGAGHGCGHNLFGAASLGAAVTIKELIESGELSGTIRFYGTPAEEKYFGKLFIARAGLYDDLDVCLDWHPSSRIEADVQSSLALVDFVVEFRGQAAHAAGDPWNGRSASDAMELMSAGINAYREHIQPTVRIHTHMQQAGDVVNVVPDYAKMWVRVRDRSREGMMPVWERVEEIAKGAAIMADVDYEITLVSGLHEVLPNRTGGAAMHANLLALGPIEYTDEETKFGYGIQEATDKPLEGMSGDIQSFKETAKNPSGGSTDVGDVSWLVPEIRLRVTTAPKATPWHSWAVVACGGMSIGHKGLVHAGKALGMTMVDLYENPELVEEIQAEFKERKGDYQYEAILPAGPPPVGDN